MRRSVALAVAVLVVAGACSGDDGDDAASSTTSSSTATSTSAPVVEPTEALRVTQECPGIGEVPPDGAELTFVKGGRIWSDDGRCLAEFTGRPELRWGGAADRLLAGERSVLLADGPTDLVGEAFVALEWSRPSGKALVVRDHEHALTKLSVDDEPPLELLGMPLGEGEVLYHPAGTAIAVIEEVGPNVVLASNRGVDPRWLLTSEPADAVTDIAFSADGDLLFVARHGAESHLHRLVLGEDAVGTELVETGAIGDVVASPWDDTAIAASRGTCEEPGELFVTVGGFERHFDGTAIERARPVGWTPDGDLVVLTRGSCGAERTTPGDLHVVSEDTISLVAEDVGGAAIRAVFPPPPPPPPEIAAAPA